jgi:hypothetical protein
MVCAIRSDLILCLSAEIAKPEAKTIDPGRDEGFAGNRRAKSNILVA